jgi:hypothetical protein
MAHLDAIAADPAYLHPLAAPIPRPAPDLEAEDAPPDLPWPLQDAPFRLDAEGHPWSETGRAMPHHVDVGGTAHWFGLVEASDEADHTHELRYFRAEVVGGELRADSHPVMPLETDDRAAAWPLPALEMELRRGDVFMAQQLAHDVAEVYDQPFPDPFDLPALDPRPDYYFGYGVGPHNQPSLEAVKTWMDGSDRRFDTLTIAEFGDYADARELEDELEALQREAGLAAAMGLAEDMATASRYLDPFRDDPRLFFEDDAPADPFTTGRQRELERETSPAADVLRPWYLDPAVQEHLEREEQLHAAFEGEMWFQATFPDDGAHLLQPLDETVNYAVVLQAADPHTSELAVEKYWREPDGRLGYDDLTLYTFDPDDEGARQQAEAQRDGLLRIHNERGLTAMMHQAELSAMERGWLAADRSHPALFPEGPPDRFESLAQQLVDETNPYQFSDDEDRRTPTPAPGSWEELLEQEANKPEEVLSSTSFDRLWYLQQRPVETPEGEPLGQALYLTYYPDVHQDAFADGAFSDADYPDHAKTLEMARFETAAQADKFAKDFAGYVHPGLLDPPELAEEVARLEGLPVQWQDLDYDGILAAMTDGGKVMREADGWSQRNPVEKLSDDITPMMDFDR